MSLFPLLRFRTLASLFAVASLAACGKDSPTSPATPAVPTGLTVVATTASSVQLRWRSVSGATGYVLERAPGASGGAFAQIATPTDTIYTDATVTASTTYRYRVAATRGTLRSGFTSDVPAVVGAAGPKFRRVESDLIANQTWFADTVYMLSGFVKVRSGVTLTIQPGTRIIGDTAAGRLGSSLWILRDARLIANGTATNPIVFTSARAAGNRKPGDWGGIVIIGRGIINRTGAEILTEGGAAGAAENYAGGTDNADSSGVLRYVRIEFAGYDVSNGGGQELNAVSMYAVGGRTKLEYVQAMAGLDDSFEWWGGAVDGRYLISYESGDDHFDWSEGYRGRNQFLIAFQTQRLSPAPNTGTFSSDPRGMEGDGCDPGVPGCAVTARGTNAPYSMPVFGNFTLLGTGQLGGYPTDGSGIVVRRGTGGTFRNGMVLRFKGTGISLRDAWTDSLRLRDSLSIDGIILAENGARFNATGLGDSTSMVARMTSVRYAPVAADLVTSLNPAALNWRPAGTLPTTGGVAAPAARVAGFFGGTWANTTYIGAVEPNAATGWWDGWTRYVIN